ncbi:MAG: GDP-mannose 4,6-dehydratase [Chloroflexi bacterium]|nr:GDP-mannose 4,6-dehydratase [Chloroflexota bacterium]
MVSKGRVLVTGGCGFVGSHLVDALLARGYEVASLSRPGCDLSNASHVSGKVPHLSAHIEDMDRLRAAVTGRWDAFFHLAALINVDQSLSEPLRFLDVNVKGTANMLELARQLGVPRFVHMSTCEVYGNIPQGKAPEDHPLNPRSPYAVSKFSAERYVLAYAYSFPTPHITLIRGFNQYGPRQSAGRFGAVIPKFIRSLLEGKTITVFGTGDQTRDYVFAEDTVQGILRAFEADLPSGEVLNLATGEDHSIRQIAEALCRLAAKDPRQAVEYIEGRRGELIRSCGDASKAQRLLGWVPTVSFSEGLARTFRWYRERFPKIPLGSG